MRCVLCGGGVAKKKSEEEVRLNGNHVLVEVEVEVCQNCHEKYYSSEVMDDLINIKETLGRNKGQLQEVGSVYRYTSK